VHETLFNIIVVLAALHAAAALKHHFFDRDNVLRSMLPWNSR
jgi:cytochrome b561